MKNFLLMTSIICLVSGIYGFIIVLPMKIKSLNITDCLFLWSLFWGVYFFNRYLDKFKN